MYIGLDIGGSKINSVLVKNRKVVKSRKVKTKSKSNKKVLVTQIFDCIEYLMGDKIKGIGIGAPEPTNVTALKNIDLAKMVHDKFGIKTKIDNDANCFGLAEAVLGAGKGFKILAGLTLGTGVGGAIIINKKIFHGVNGKAAEFGHMIIKKDGRKCNCGKRGCLEAYISANISTKEKEEYLEIGVVNIIKILDPDIIVIGGGLANIIALPLTKNTKIVKAKFNEDAGAIGAALLFK